MANNENGIYVTGCVIPNGLPDHENDVLTKKDIKIIFTKYLNHDTDTMHSYIRNEGVDLLANWISEKETRIKGKIAPAGSWLATFYVTNPEIIESIKSSEKDSINGLSLGSVPKSVTDIKYWFINKSINYKDLDTIDDAVPMFISFVDKPSNGFGLEVEEYNVYINKSESEEVIMTNKNNEPIEEEKLTLSGWERVIKGFQSLGINKSEAGATETPHKEEVENKPPANNEEGISNEELAKKIDNIPNAVTTGIVEAFKEIGANQQTPVEPVKNDEEGEDDESEPVKVDETPAKKTKEAGVNKRATGKEENITQPNTTTNFYQKSGRDMFGCRIKKL